MKVDFRFDDSDIKAAIASVRGKFPMAVRRSLKRAGDSGKTVMVRLIAKDLGLSQRALRDDVRVNVVGDTGVQIEARGKRIPLIEFGARGPEPSRGRGRGVSYRLPGGRGRAPSAFIATLGTGKRGVFVRKGTSRLPIRELQGPSIVRVFERFSEEGVARGREVLMTNLRHEVERAMRRNS